MHHLCIYVLYINKCFCSLGKSLSSSIHSSRTNLQVLVLRLQVLVPFLGPQVLVPEPQVLVPKPQVLILVLRPQVLVLEPQVLDSITGVLFEEDVSYQHCVKSMCIAVDNFYVNMYICLCREGSGCWYTTTAGWKSISRYHATSRQTTFA